jgi:hypothetical protein
MYLLAVATRQCYLDEVLKDIGEGRMYEKVGSSMCPVASFTKYLSKLHPDNIAL